MRSTIETIFIALSLVALAGLGWYSYTLHTELVATTASLADERHTTAQLEAELQNASTTIQQLETNLTTTKGELEDLADDYRRAARDNKEFSERVDELNDTLDKLANLDEELLQKYSRVYFLNENYQPSRLKQIDNDWIMEGKDIQYFHADAIRSLESMLERAERAGHDLRIISAYRSFDHQNALKGEFTQVYGSGANTFSADQGYSEHQLGTAVDIVDTDTGATSQAFANTEAYQWLLDNAHRYGFILSYPENNSFYIFEPWHWRFVGVDLATDLHNAEAGFYDWEQRRIDEYLLEIFD